MTVSVEQIREALKNVVEPDLKKDIVELELVKDIQVSDKNIILKVLVSNPAMHNKKRMQDAVAFAIERLLGKEYHVEVNVEGLPKDRDPQHRKLLQGVKNIVAISSGKGGVGKSTVTANLALGLKEMGYKVGLVDADIYGPSMPLMFDVIGEKPLGRKIDGETKMVPVESHGIKILSIGFFADPEQAVAWRGAMANKAIHQMFADADWGDLDYLLIDLPPGTGDIHLSIVQNIPLTGAVVVSTPQEVALTDARKGINLFRLPQINVPILGVIENMSYFTPAELPDNKYYIFGKEGAQKLAESMDVALLGEIPLVQSVREAGDVGRPAILQGDTPVAQAFKEISSNLVDRVNWRNENLEPTKIVKMTK